MAAIQIATGTIIQQKEVYAITLTNKKGTIVKVFNYGAVLNKFVVTNNKGDKQDIVLGFDDLDGYLSTGYLSDYPYFGAAIGRYANRIKGGVFEVDGIWYQLATNVGNDALHGGIEGFDKKVWDIVELNGGDNPSVLLHYYSEDGEEGYPGDLAVQLLFTLTESDELILTYQADTDEATPVNLTHHSYFNLSTTRNDIEEHEHQILASNWLAQDENFVVTGEQIAVESTPYDFRTPKPIAKDWDADKGYDQSFVLDKNYGDLTLASRTTDASSGLTLAIYTTEPVVHFYTAKNLHVAHGKDGKTYGSSAGFCIETQHAPNSLNLVNYPSTILQPDSFYRQTTIYKVTVN